MQFRKFLAAMFAAVLVTGASVANAAAPIAVTWNPAGAGISTQGPFTFDNVVLNTYANIDITGGGTAFTETGFLKLSIFFNGPTVTSIPTAGFPAGTPYSLYISFTATGTQTPGIPSTGSFTSLNYSLLGAAGVTSFSANAAGVFSSTGAPAVTLATGSLKSPGTTSLTIDPVTGLLNPAASVFASFVPNPAFSAFFVNPNSSQTLDISGAFTNTGTVITQFALPNNGGTRLSLNGGGGNATFALAAIPEPDTYGMLLAGLGLFGFIARRKSNRYAA